MPRKAKSEKRRKANSLINKIWALICEKHKESGKDVKNMPEETLKLCLKFRRCKECKRVMQRGENYCPMCMFRPRIKSYLREDFLRWYKKEGEPLENVLPNPMPTIKNIMNMLREVRREKP